MSNEFNDKSVGVASGEFSLNATVIPESLKFGKVAKTIAARRVPVKIRAEQQSYSSDKNKLIRIPLPDGALYDTRLGYLTFNALVTKTGGTYVRFASGIFSIFNRIRVLAGSTEIEDIRDYNRISAILFELFSPILSTGNVGVTSMGFGTQAQRNTLGASATGTDYACPLFSGVFGTELLPLDNIQNDIFLEMYIEDPTVCVETDGTLPIITISSVLFHIERLELQDDYRRFIASTVRTNGLTLGWHAWERFSQTLAPGTNQNVTISAKNSSLSVMLNIFLDSSTINSTTTNDKFLTWQRQNLTSSQLFINGRVFPDEPVDTLTCSAWECYQTYLEWITKWRLNGIIPIAPPINAVAFFSDRFFQLDDLEPFPELDDVINPFNTIGNNINLIKKYTFSAATPANYQLDTWVQSFRQIYISPDGSVRVNQ